MILRYAAIVAILSAGFSPCKKDDYNNVTPPPVPGPLKTTYDNWIAYDGFMAIHGAANTTNIIAKGNIGSN